MDSVDLARKASVAADHEPQPSAPQPSTALMAWQNAILEAALDCVIVSDHEGRILEFNPAAESTFGYLREAVIGKPMADVIVPPSLRSSHEQGFKRCVETGQSSILGKRIELVGRRSDGSEFPAELTVARIDTPGPPRFVGYLRDLSDRKRAEEAVRLNLQIQSALNSLLELSLEPLTLAEQLEQTLDLLFSIPWIELESKGAIFLAEGTPPALVMKAQRGLPETLLTACANVPFGHCLCGRAAASRQTVFSDCLDDRHDTCYEGVVPHGHYCVPIISEGRLYGVLNLYLKEGHQRKPEEDAFLGAVARVLAGIVRRRQAEESLRESEERFELAVRGTDAGIWDWDLRTNAVYYSPHWKRMLGYAEDELAGDYVEWESRLHPEDRERALAAIRDYLGGTTSEYELEHRLRHKDGSYRWMLARGAAVRDGHGEPYRMVGSHLDITERRQSEERLTEREAQLLAAQRIQERLLPPGSPVVPGFDITGKVFPAEFAGGDYFDYLCLADHSLGIVVGDVSGHGVSSALLTASTCAHLRSFVTDHTDVREILEHTNSILCWETEEGRFVTLLFARLDLNARTVHYVNAGHPSGYVLARSGDVKAVLQSSTVPLAILPETEFPVGGPIQLEPEEILLLVTDGILEARSPDCELFGADRMLDVVRAHRRAPSSDIIAALHHAIHDFTQRPQQVDDLTAVVVKVEAAGESAEP
jgi:PAS domain S-box-containing protein